MKISKEKIAKIAGLVLLAGLILLGIGYGINSFRNESMIAIDGEEALESIDNDTDTVVLKSLD